MSFVSISNSSIPAASVAKYLAKKERGNKSAELKQDKLDVRRQRRHSQVKNEGHEEELSGGGEMHEATRTLEITPTNGEKDDSMHNDLDLSWNSPSGHTGSAVESNCSGTNFSGSSRSCSSGTFYSRNISEVEDDGGLDDWEAVADALAATDDKKDQRDQKMESSVEDKNVAQLDHLPEVVNQPTATMDVLEPKSEKSPAWSHGDAFLSKPKPENRPAWRRGDTFHSKPKPEKGQAWRRSNAFHTNPKPEYRQRWRHGDAFRWKPKPENGQWRGDDFHSKPKPEKRDQQSTSLVENKNVTQLDHLPEVMNQPIAALDVLKPKPENGQAWRHGDAFPPKTLLNLEKKHIYPMKANRHYRHGGTTLGCKNFVSPPSSCPICCEDLDSTDSSFLPCSCGFQLCLFCHKRILEEDGRCPGCRKHYDNDAVKWEENSDLTGASATLRLIA